MDLFDAAAEGSDSDESDVNAIANRLSLRPPQRESLEILARVAELLALDGVVSGSLQLDIGNALKTIQSEFKTVTDFERDFPSLCFALATGVGKTRLMGAFIAYLFRQRWQPPFLRSCAEPNDLQQAHHRFHTQHAEVRVRGHSGVRNESTGANHWGQLRERAWRSKRGSRSAGLNVRYEPDSHQHLQHLARSTVRFVGARHPRIKRLQRVHRPELFRIPGGAQRSGAADGRVAPLSSECWREGDQRTEADHRTWNSRRLRKSRRAAKLNRSRT